MITRLRSARFQTKVLVPVVAVMVLMVAITIYLVNFRLTLQMRKQANEALVTADAVFKSFQRTRAETLRLRLNHIPAAPHYRATFQQGDAATIQEMLDKNTVEIRGDLVQFKNAEGQTLALSRRDPSLNVMEFQRNSEPSSKRVFEDGVAVVDTIRVSERLFEVVTIPVVLPVSGELLGALTFCIRFGDSEAQQLSEVSGCSVVLIANSNVVSSSFRQQDLLEECVNLFGGQSAMRIGQRAVPANQREIVKPEETFLPLVGRFESMSGDTKLGYVLLYSYAPSLRELRATQRMIVGASLGGMLFAIVVVWFLVRNVTRPLRELRDSAEAVGRGDFTQRLPVGSQDECGELANVFNRMTENLQTSRHQLEESVTTLRTTQAQLIQREKLSAIGEFVAGVTHELNNPLTAVLGFSELLQKTNVDERQHRFIDRIAHSARRCQKIVQSLLSFARQHAPERKATSVNQLIENVVEIMAYEMRTSNIDVQMQLAQALPQVLVDSHQVQQVFLNIVNNGRQAMEAHQHAGVLRIATEVVSGRVQITFSDNGPGISAENLKKIFDPFFTTKEAGKGTGLGLSLSYGIIQEHGGTISVRSMNGQGAVFVIQLPAHALTGAVGEEVKPKPRDVPIVSKGGGKRVLVVDDEAAILDFVGEVLKADGYNVDTASNGETALRQLREHHYDVTLCDWKMPGMNGQQLFEHISGENREASERFVFMTGDVINGRMESFLAQRKCPCLAKPFSVAEFQSMISRISTGIPSASSAME
ncbi:MAG TPA: ATP-binding protein [Candidatus Acidoferrum sp.]|nr:ATP-binding protein [Candidatus Acidoferrum sp.]